MEGIGTAIAVAFLLAIRIGLPMAILFGIGYLLEPNRQSRIGRFE